MAHLERRLSGPRWWPRRRGIEIKVAVIFIIVFCYVIIHASPFSRSDDAVEAATMATTRTPMPPRDGSASALLRMGVDPSLMKDKSATEDTLPGNIPTKDESNQDELSGTKPIEKSAPGHQDVLQPGQEATEASTPLSHSRRKSDLKQVSKALRNVISHLPDEGEVEDMLVPIQGTGTVKLRDVGIKTRLYKKYLGLWEALHVVHDGQNAHVRDDILRVIRDSHDHLDIPTSTVAQTLRSYQNFRNMVTSLADLLFPWTAPYFADHMTLHASLYKAGRGIVLSAGNDQVPYLLATIPAMRKLGCTLPIEIMYLGDEDINEEYRETLELLPGVITRDIKQMTKDAGWELAGWAAKPFAMLLSSFQEVLFIDADAVFFRNPEMLFEDPQYKAHGALFFMDRSLFPESKRRWMKSFLPKPISKSAQKTRPWTGESGHQQESGVVLIDKWRHFVELLLVTRLNGPDRDGNKDEGIEGIYDMVYGDKETFWLSWELLRNSNYAFHTGYRGTMGAIHRGTTPTAKEEFTDEADASGELVSGKTSQDLDDSSAPRYEIPDAEDSTGPRYETESDYSDDAAADATNQAAKDIADAEAEPDAPHEAILAAEAEQPLADMSLTNPPQLHEKRKRSSTYTEKPTNYTICAPQLLHLDENRRPLWFNGWLARNKFKDPTQSVPASFEVWNIEPPMASKTDAWKLGEANEACLTTDTVMEFTKEEQEVLEMVIEFAQKAKALGKRQK